MVIEVRSIHYLCVGLCMTLSAGRTLGYGPLIRTYVQFLLAKLRFHRLRPEFNGLFEYEEYVTLKGIDDPNEGYVDIRWYSVLGIANSTNSNPKLRNHLRPYGPARSDRGIPEDGLLAFPQLCK